MNLRNVKKGDIPIVAVNNMEGATSNNNTQFFKASIPKIVEKIKDDFMKDFNEKSSKDMIAFCINRLYGLYILDSRNSFFTTEEARALMLALKFEASYINELIELKEHFSLDKNYKIYTLKLLITALYVNGADSKIIKFHMDQWKITCLPGVLYDSLTKIELHKKLYNEKNQEIKENIISWETFHHKTALLSISNKLNIDYFSKEPALYNYFPPLTPDPSEDNPIPDSWYDVSEWLSKMFK